MPKSALTAVAIAGLVLTASACTKDDASPTSTATTTGASTSATSTAPTTSTTASSTSAPAALPTPFTDDRGKKLDKPDAVAGTEIENNGAVSKLQVKPGPIVQAKAADLGGVKIGKDRVPFFVTMTYTNAGTKALEYPTLGSNLVVKDTSGGLVSTLDTNKTIKGCPTPQPPESVKPFASVTECQVYLLGKGEKISTISYRDASGTRDKELSWTINPLRKS